MYTVSSDHYYSVKISLGAGFNAGLTASLPVLSGAVHYLKYNIIVVYSSHQINKFFFLCG